MSYWPFWAGGLALAAVMLGHWLLLGRTMGVSGRFTALVNRARFGAQEPALSEAELIALMQAETMAEFGVPGDASSPVANDVSADLSAAAPAREPLPDTAMHFIFLLGLVLGGLISQLLPGAPAVSASGHSPLWTHFFGGSSWAMIGLLTLGGTLVGFGTRMAGGCTSGHGLCGVSRFQPGSLLTTAAFFGAAVALSFALEAL